jgi:ATPase subunit of ABC transporter with duplicated ATPase domains
MNSHGERNAIIKMFPPHQNTRVMHCIVKIKYLRPLFSSIDARQHLGSFGLSGALPLSLIRNLSGGEKTRLTFASVCWTKPHVLILDEVRIHIFDYIYRLIL